MGTRSNIIIKRGYVSQTLYFEYGYPEDMKEYIEKIIRDLDTVSQEDTVSFLKKMFPPLETHDDWEHDFYNGPGDSSYIYTINFDEKSLCVEKVFAKMYKIFLFDNLNGWECVSR